MQNRDYSLVKKIVSLNAWEKPRIKLCSDHLIPKKENSDQVKSYMSCTHGLKSLSKYDSTKLLTDSHYVLIPVILILLIINCILHVKWSSVVKVIV
jgi:hypothetical protein